MESVEEGTWRNNKAFSARFGIKLNTDRNRISALSCNSAKKRSKFPC